MTAMFRMYDQYSKEIKFSELQNPEESWELLDLIGEGTYGEVYSVKNKQTGNNNKNYSNDNNNNNEIK